MRRFWQALAFAVALWSSTVQSDRHTSLAVIVTAHSPLDHLAEAQIQAVFQRRSLLDAQGKRWFPVNLPVAHPLRRAFSLAVLHGAPEDQEAYWNELYFQGISPPEVLDSEEAVLRFVAATPGAIGYVSTAIADTRVKVIARVASEDSRP